MTKRSLFPILEEISMEKKSLFWAMIFLGLVSWGIATPLRAEEPSKYFGKEVEAVGSLNFQQIIQSDLAKKYKVVNLLKIAIENELQNNQELKKIQEEVDFDVLEDLNSIHITATGDQNPETILFVIDGKFNSKKLEAFGAKAVQNNPDTFKVHPVGQNKIYEMAPQGEEKVFLCLVNEETLLVSLGKDLVENAVKGAEKGGNANASVKSLLKSAGAKKSVSFLFTKTAMKKGLQQVPEPQAAQAQMFLQKINGATFTVKIGTDIRFRLGFEANNPTIAQEFTQQMAIGLFAAKGMLAQQAPQDAKMALAREVVQTLRVIPEGNMVYLSGRISPQVIENAKKEFEKEQGGNGGDF